MGANGKQASKGKISNDPKIAQLQYFQEQSARARYKAQGREYEAPITRVSSIPVLKKGVDDYNVKQKAALVEKFPGMFPEWGAPVAIPEVPAWKQKILDARAQRAAASAAATKTAAVAAPKTDDLALGGTTSVLG